MARPVIVDLSPAMSSETWRISWQWQGQVSRVRGSAYRLPSCKDSAGAPAIYDKIHPVTWCMHESFCQNVSVSVHNMIILLCFFASVQKMVLQIRGETFLRLSSSTWDIESSSLISSSRLSLSSFPDRRIADCSSNSVTDKIRFILQKVSTCFSCQIETARESAVYFASLLRSAIRAWSLILFDYFYP